MVFLPRVSDLHIGQDEYSRREVNARGRVDASDLLEDLGSFAAEFFEVFAEGVEAIADIVFVGVSS